jgi:hypothetical protein
MEKLKKILNLYNNKWIYYIKYMLLLQNFLMNNYNHYKNN